MRLAVVTITQASALLFARKSRPPAVAMTEIQASHGKDQMLPKAIASPRQTDSRTLLILPIVVSIAFFLISDIDAPADHSLAPVQRRDRIGHLLSPRAM